MGLWRVARPGTGMAEPDIAPERAFVLGLDGVPWSLVERWVDDGALPNLARVVAEGAAGELRSTTPAVTSLAWPSIATGTWPSKHGVYDFQKLTGDYGQRMYTSVDVRRPALWDVLTPAVVGNVPMTYPADLEDGRMVSGMVTPSTEGRFTHPPELASEIRQRVPGYRIGLEWSEYAGRTEEFLEDLQGLVEARRELMRLLMETDDWRLFFFVYTAPDRLQHLVWDDDRIRRHYQRLDEVVGEVMEYVSAHDGVLFVVSDHGFGPIDRYVYLNRILETAGYLRRKGAAGTRALLSRANVSRETIGSLLDAVGLSRKTLARYLPRQLTENVAAGIPGEHALYDVDHGRTRAFVFGPGTLYINDTRRFDRGVVDPEDVPALRRELTALLEAVVDPRTGERVLDVVDGEDLFPDDPWAPDLVVVARGRYERAKSLSDEVFAYSTGHKQASHRPDGLFMAWGPAIGPGTTPDDAAVVDVAPTVLHCLGEPVGADMDGRVLSEILAAGSAPARRAVETEPYHRRLDTRADRDPDPDEDYDTVRDRLQGLGYLE